MSGVSAVCAACLVAAAVLAGWSGTSRRARQAQVLTGPTRVVGGPTAPVRLALGHLAAAPRPVTLLAAALAGVAGAAVGGPVAALAAGAYAALGAHAWLCRRRDHLTGLRRRRQLDELGALAADLRAGLPPPAGGLPAAGALSAADAAPAGRSLTARGDTAGDIAGGDRLGELTVAAFRLAEETGAPLADLLDRIEADARAADAARATAVAQAAGARVTAVLLAALPAAGIGLGYAMGVDPVGVLLHTPVGAACALAAILLQVTGLAWSRRLVGIQP